jgi:hypothetical protein
MRPLLAAMPYVQAIWAGIFAVAMLPRFGSSLPYALMCVLVVGYFAASAIAVARHLNRRRAE